MNITGQVGEVVQVDNSGSRLKIRYSDDLEKWEQKSNLSEEVVSAGNWKEKNNYPKADRVVSYRY